MAELQPLGIYVPDTVNTTLQSCINSAATNPRGIVWVPASYAGTDTYTNPNNVPVFDMRSGGTLSFDFLNSDSLTILGATSGSVVVSVPAVAGFNTATLPANTGTVAELNLAQSWTALQQFLGITAQRVKVNQGTAYSGADAAITLSAGWGSSAAVSSATGYDQAFSFTVTPAGTGIASNPTITVTFKDGTFTTAPQFLVSRNDLNAPYGMPPHTITVTATTLVITFNGLPNNAGLTYNFIALALGN